MEYQEMKKTPEFLKDLKVKAVYAPRQDGWHEHYALLDITDDFPRATANTIEGIVEVANVMKEKARI